MIRPSLAVILILVGTTVFLINLTEAAVPTLDDLEKLTIIGPLGPTARKKMEDYIGYWVNQMKSAKKYEAIVEAKEKLVKGYGIHNSPYWQTSYAGVCAERLVSVLNFPDPVKQIQAGMTLAKIPQYTIQPAVEQMANHPNPAVRYWAAKAYKASLRRMLLYDARAKKMLGTLKRLGLADSGPILLVVLRSVNPYPDMDEKTISTMKSLLDEIWLARCKDIRNGRADVIQAYRRMIRFIIPFNQSDKTRVLQLLADALEAASLAFVKIGDRKTEATRRLKELLISLENRLAEITSTTEAPMRKILDDKIPPMEKAIKVRLKVNEYWKPILAKYGIKPRIHALKKNTATRPTTTTTTSP